MPSPPATKKQKMDDAGSSRVQTRAQAAAANPPPAASSPASDHDDDDADDEVGFEYESFDEEEPVDEQAQSADEDAMDVDTPGGASGGGNKVETLVLSDSDDDGTNEPPPEPVSKPKGKLTARKQFAKDIEDTAARYGAGDDDTVKNITRDEGDDMVRFTLKHANFPRGLKLALMFPELGGYPQTHEVMCFSENEDIGPEIEEVMGEVAQLPSAADRSLNGIIEFLIHRIVRGQPSVWALAPGQETDEENMSYDDELYSLNASMKMDSLVMKALRSDFKGLLDAGYRPGFTRVSELDLVVSVSKKVNSLGVPARALQAWDSQLITGEVVYLVLLMNFGSTYPVDLDNQSSGQVRFKVGISPKYKPSKAAVGAAFRSHSSHIYTKGEFEAISLSAPLDALLNNKFQEIVATRRCNDRCGWASAEQHCFGAERQGLEVNRKKGKAADKAEKDTSEAHADTLPDDPMEDSKTQNNFPLLAFSYLVRRFVMCPRFCLNCFKRCDETITALKPFVCDTPLCLFQLIALGLGPSLEHEIITNTSAVDLLVQLCYTAAKENALKDELLPTGLELKVPKDKLDGTWMPGDETVDLDTLAQDHQKCSGVAALILELPPISEMKVWLTGEDMTEDEKILNRTRKLPEMRNGIVSTSAWRLLRWIVASNTSYLKQIEDDDELIQGIPKDYRQFRLIVGSPAKEHLLAESVKAAQAKDKNAVKYPTLFAFHGSGVKNWHSILRQGLHFKETVNGRAYGHGVYLAKQGDVSLGHYAAAANNYWKNAEFGVSKLAAICEVNNLPKEFVSSNPYFVIAQLDWIITRYLIVQRGTTYNATDTASSSSAVDLTGPAAAPKIKTIKLDPAHPLTLSNSEIQIPDVADKLKKLEARLTDAPEELNDSDTEVLHEPTIVLDAPAGSQGGNGGGNGNGGGRMSKVKRALSGALLSSSSNGKDKGKGKEVDPAQAPAPAKKPDTFVPCDAARLKLVTLLPPPQKPNKMAMTTLQREIKAMMKAQEEKGPTEVGYYFDPERSDDNVFNWIVELPQESFDQDIPLAKDMKAKGVKSILMEIRFGDSFPFSPPFFRVVHPRFLPFVHGGGGHVTGGGSICMDLLTNDGWLSSYSIEAILLQIRMAMSNLEPRPARLDSHSWDTPYNMEEAIAGFKRAAATHNWTIPPELEKIARGL
ncbi:hypothetical protein JCM10207_006044 [Rhodosporidiobolus poonsookiae]